MYVTPPLPIVVALDSEQFIAGLAGASQATSFNGLMIARVVHGFASGICEALPVQMVNDVFFLHERGRKIGYYTGIDTSHPYEFFVR